MSSLPPLCRSSSKDATVAAPGAPLRRLDSARSLETVAAIDAAANGLTDLRLALENGKAVQAPSSGNQQGISLTKDHLDAVVKVYCTHSAPNFALPWQRKTQTSSTSTGFAVSGPKGERWLLTNAHSVSYHAQVKVKQRGADKRFAARVLSIGHECDIALLSVDDEAFWVGVQPLEFGIMPQLQESVAVVGYPIGGDSLSVSVGVTSRIEMTKYAHGCFTLLGLQIDAAINSGNSGGPVFNAQGECVGIAFQTFAKRDSESIGYVIPNSVVAHFITDYLTNGTYTGFPSLNVTWQCMESDALRESYSMSPEHKGVLVRQIPEASHEAEVLQVDDVILSIDGVGIGNDGTVPFRNGERVNFSYLVTQRHVGEELKLEVLRKGQVLPLRVTLRHFQFLVPPHVGEQVPGYLLVAGLVFTRCTDPFLEQKFGSISNAPEHLSVRSYYDRKRHPEHELVLLSACLSCGATSGYERLRNMVVMSFNDQPVRNLEHLSQLVDACPSSDQPFMRFGLDPHNSVIVVTAAEAMAATEGVMEENGIPARMSKDLRDAKAARETAARGEGDAAAEPETQGAADAKVARDRGGAAAGSETPVAANAAVQTLNPESPETLAKAAGPETHVAVAQEKVEEEEGAAGKVAGAEVEANAGAVAQGPQVGWWWW